MTAETRKRDILLTLMISLFAGGLPLSALPVALPSIADALGLSAVQTGGVSVIFALVSAAFILPVGRLADIIGRRRIFATGLATVATGMAASALAPSWLPLMAAQALTGLGTAMSIATGMALLSSAFPAQERGRALGMVTAAVYLGHTLGPSIGGLLTHHFGWRSIFLPSILLHSLLLFFFLRRVGDQAAEAHGESFDFAGAAIFSVMLFCILYGFSSMNLPVGRWALAAGALLFIAFVIQESRVTQPMLDLRLVTGNRLFAFSDLTHLLFYVAVVPMPFLLSLYLQYVRGYDPQQTGFLLLLQPAIMVVVSPFAGRLADRIDPRVLVTAGIAIVTCSLLLYLAAITRGWQPGIAAGLLTGGVGFALFSSPNSNAIMGSVASRHYGVAAAFESTMRGMGIAFGMGIVMMLFSLRLGGMRITPEHHAAFVDTVKLALVIGVAISVASMSFSVARGPSPARARG